MKVRGLPVGRPHLGIASRKSEFRSGNLVARTLVSPAWTAWSLHKSNPAAVAWGHALLFVVDGGKVSRSIEHNSVAGERPSTSTGDLRLRAFMSASKADVAAICHPLDGPTIARLERFERQPWRDYSQLTANCVDWVEHAVASILPELTLKTQGVRSATISSPDILYDTLRDERFLRHPTIAAFPSRDDLSRAVSAASAR